MGAAVKAATKIQIGKEVTPGTPVAATRRLIGSGRFRRIEEFEDFADNDYGHLANTGRDPLNTRNGMEFEYTAPLSMEELLFFLLSGMKGGVTPGAGTGDFTWTFNPSATADPAIDPYTLEFVEDNFTDQAEMESPYVFCNEIEISGGVEGVPQLRASLMGRKVVDSTLTPALTVPALNYIANLKWGVYLDSTWAGLGGTQVTGQVYGFRWRYGEGNFPRYYLDARADLDYSNVGFRKRRAELELDIIADTASGSFAQAQKAIKSAGTRQFVRAQILGATVGLKNYEVTLDGAYHHAADSMQEHGSEQDGNLTLRAHLVSTYDATTANEVEVVDVNGLAAFP